MPTTLDAWVGRTTSSVEALTPRSVAGLLAAMDLAEAIEGAAAPLLAHWLVAPDIVPQHRLGEDGHPLRGGLLPPVALPRRMWASSALRLHAPLPVGVPLERRSTVASVASKTGRSGALIFVDIDHAWSGPGGVPLVDDRQSIVYRAMTPVTAATAPSDAASPADALDWPLRRDLVPSTTLLFRYSALTFNAHRIHYDAAYASEVEGYPALVVQGPLIATLLAALCTQALGPACIAAFSFRSLAPAYVDRPLRLRGRLDGAVVALRALDGAGRVVLSAQAMLAA